MSTVKEHLWVTLLKCWKLNKKYDTLKVQRPYAIKNPSDKAICGPVLLPSSFSLKGENKVNVSPSGDSKKNKILIF